ncbi:sulfite exporter TauE/SafE family protein [Thiohalobacter sp. IOR34]|uniref:sulfite exporter TauE/SafE family protein n=1 Tax=Thiohalobacter sp. IOR34 TaxID=3057176 RepID=UPI0025B23B99|nr:sulfite exporter TauE/SafE family protein [Thiohalobacter sp. IOR34]WJW75453.1 sulfite exporter TauE/SafE family protein [Thiohalobacter sp. IOR34]
MTFSLFVPLLIGLASVLHCIGMCGGIMGALTMSLPAEIRSDRRHLVRFVLAYNLGRITSYILAGALIGGLGTRLFEIISPQYGHAVIRGLSALLLVSIGLYLAGWFPDFARVEKLGTPLWRRLEPLGQRLLPVRRSGQALLFGVIWGWLPCGLVYSTLLWVAAAGDALHGALYMALFGLGTLPGVLTMGLMTGWSTRLMARRDLRRVIGVLLVLFGLASLWFAPQHEGHAGHEAANDPHQLHAPDQP